MERINELQTEIKEWSDSTFDKYRIALPIAYHLKKEVDELIEKLIIWNKGNYGSSEDYFKNLYEVEMEFADCFMLLLDSASHFPMSMDTLFKRTEEKLEINKKRKWGVSDEHGVIEHIKENI